MRLRRAVWRAAGPVAGRVASGPTRAYYDAVTGSAVRALRSVPGVIALYAYGSYGRPEFRPGRSDVDLLAVVEDTPVAGELELVAALRGPYRRRQAILPLSLSVLQRSEFERGAGWLSWARTRIGSGLPHSPVAAWTLLGGQELRSASIWQPDGRLWYITEAHVAAALAAAARGPAAVLTRLAVLAADLEKEDLPAEGLRVRDPAVAIQSALAVIDEQRRRCPLPAEAIGVDGAGSWIVDRPDAEAARRASELNLETARSATLVRLPFEPLPVVLVEAVDIEAALPLIRQALELKREGLTLHVTTSRLAEDSWRSGFRWIGVATGVHLAGDPLAPRLQFPSRATCATLLEARAWTAAGYLRRCALGMRMVSRDDSVLLALALIARLLRDEPPLTIAGKLLPDRAVLDDFEWLRRGLELWTEARSLVGQQHSFLAHPVAID